MNITSNERVLFFLVLIVFVLAAALCLWCLFSSLLKFVCFLRTFWWAFAIAVAVVGVAVALERTVPPEKIDTLVDISTRFGVSFVDGLTAKALREAVFKSDAEVTQDHGDGERLPPEATQAATHDIDPPRTPEELPSSNPAASASFRSSPPPAPPDERIWNVLTRVWNAVF